MAKAEFHIQRRTQFPIRRDNGDNLLVTAQVGEMFVNEAHQRKAQLSTAMTCGKKIGIPGFCILRRGGQRMVSTGHPHTLRLRGQRRCERPVHPATGSAGGSPRSFRAAQQALSERPIVVDVREVTDSGARCKCERTGQKA